MSATDYTINLVNSGENTEDFWCFLSAPVIDVGPTVYAYSHAHIRIKSNSTDVNQFIVPLQYKVQAGSSNNAVGLHVQINSSATHDADLGSVWNATYYTDGNEGPDLALGTGTSAPGTLNIVTNPYDQAEGRQNDWYASQTFGIQTEMGFVGVTWEPKPNDNVTITPHFSFYISTGSFTAGNLADMTTVSNRAAQITLDDFQGGYEVWVQYTTSGQWNITTTDPQPPSSRKVRALDSLAQSYQHVSDAGAPLMAYQVNAPVNAGTDTTVPDEVDSVTWNKVVDRDVDTGNPIVTGSITVATAASLAFTSFVCAGITFDARGSNRGTTWAFSYRGSQSVDSLKKILKTGASIMFGK